MIHPRILVVMVVEVYVLSFHGTKSLMKLMNLPLQVVGEVSFLSLIGVVRIMILQRILVVSKVIQVRFRQNTKIIILKRVGRYMFQETDTLL